MSGTGTVYRALVALVLVCNLGVLGTTGFLLVSRETATAVTHAEILTRYQEATPSTPPTSGTSSTSPDGAPTTSRSPTAPSASAASSTAPDPSDPTSADADPSGDPDPSTGAAPPSTEPPTTTAPPTTSPSPSDPATTAAREAPGYQPPPPGVYTYATTGSESVSMLDGHRDYPSETYAAVTAEDGCAWRMELTVFEEHVDEWDMCSEPGRLTRPGHARTITWFGTTVRGTYDCGSPLVFDDPSVQVGATTTYEDCMFQSDARANIDVTLLERGPFPVGGVEVDAISVEVVMHASGSVRGTSTTRYWLAADTGMILFVERTVDNTSDQALGEVTYREHATFTLTSLTPET